MSKRFFVHAVVVAFDVDENSFEFLSNSEIDIWIHGGVVYNRWGKPCPGKRTPITT